MSTNLRSVPSGRGVRFYKYAVHPINGDAVSLLNRVRVSQTARCPIDGPASGYHVESWLMRCPVLYTQLSQTAFFVSHSKIPWCASGFPWTTNKLIRQAHLFRLLLLVWALCVSLRLAVVRHSGLAMQASAGEISYSFRMIPRGLLDAWIAGNPHTTRPSTSRAELVHMSR
jgi:hypothetical protein